MKFIFYILIFSCIVQNIFAQNQRTINAVFVSSPPRIDGNLDDSIWQYVAKQDEFIQYEPYNNTNASQTTNVYFAYDNAAIYIAAECKTDSTAKVFNLLSKRDDFGQADYFGIYLDTYNTAISGYGFFVTAAGVQVDLKIDDNKKDYTWDAVWFSKVVSTDSGFTVEMKIPFSAFRFPRGEKSQTWGVNFYRNIQDKREIDTWNYVDINKNGILNQMGKVTGLANLKPPLHLDIMPHFTGSIQNNSDYGLTPPSYTIGFDLKYSINESFTVDAMLVPDFGQIRSDDRVLNLSPYEVYYDEKRYFFTEGTEIFNKGGIFYSRRIGRRPTSYDAVYNHLEDNEIVINNPEQTTILNAVKFSGKTKTGFGIGFLNAVTANAYAKIIDTVNGLTRTYLTEPWANYNVIAISDPLPNNSYLSFTNTVYYSPGTRYNAEVWAQTLVLRNKKNSWAVKELLSQSYIFDDTLSPVFGNALKFSILKTSGKFRVSWNNTIYDDKYNPNDMGYLPTNNIVLSSFSTSYNVYKPFWKLLNFRNNINITHKRLYQDFKNVSTVVTLRSMSKLKNFTSTGIEIQIQPLPAFDYFEPRTEGWYFVKDKNYRIKTWISTNYSNPVAFDGSFYYKSVKQRLVKPWEYGFAYAPRIRMSDKILFTVGNSFRFLFNDAGYVSKNTENDSIFFGIRNIRNRIITIEFDYNIKSNIYTNIRLRHNWTTVKYSDYYILSEYGFLYPLDKPYHYFSNKNINSNFFNIDFIFKYIIRPGNELTVSLKYQINSSSQNIVTTYYDNFEEMYFENPRLLIFSVKLVLYFNSYNNSKFIKKIIKHL